MKICDRCLKRDPEATLTLIFKRPGEAELVTSERNWDFCKSCVKEVAAWIAEGNAAKEEPVKLASSAKGTEGESK